MDTHTREPVGLVGWAEASGGICTCPYCPAHARGMSGAKCCAGIDHDRMLPTTRTPARKKEKGGRDGK